MQPVHKDMTKTHRKQLLGTTISSHGNMVTIFRDKFTDQIRITRFEPLGVTHKSF